LRPDRKQGSLRGSAWLLALGLMWLLGGCASVATESGRYGVPAAGGEVATAPYERLDQEVAGQLLALKRHINPPLASKQQIRNFTGSEADIYRIGPGDEFSLMVRGREDISVPQVRVSPDGLVALPRVGLMKIQGMSLTEATDYVRKALEQHYDDPEVTLLMRTFNNNKVLMLGQVSNPGVIHIPSSATLLEAIAMAGGVVKDTQGFSPPLNRCIIGRGSDQVIWIDLRDLMENGNLALNARLQNGDVVLIPQGQDTVAYVLGEVRKPGPLMLRSPMTVLDAVTQSGGLTKDADSTRIYLVRAEGDRGVVQQVDLKTLVEKADFRKNFALQEGDLVFVAERGISNFHYYLSRILPTMTVVNFAASADGG
jgi:polysaccharide biosynthesis/export protein